MDGEIKDLQCPTSKEFPFYSLDFQINLVLYQVPFNTRVTFCELGVLQFSKRNGESQKRKQEK